MFRLFEDNDLKWHRATIKANFILDFVSCMLLMMITWQYLYRHVAKDVPLFNVCILVVYEECTRFLYMVMYLGVVVGFLVINPNPGLGLHGMLKSFLFSG
jgi:hypothetical protein